MNLEQFPANETARRMLSYLPADFYRRSYVGKWLFQVMGEELEKAREIYEALPNQAFPETATWGIPYHEQMYKILSDPSLPLKERRAEILRRRDIRCPMNPARLEKLVSGMAGTEAEVAEDIAPYTFLVRLLLEDGDGEIDYEAVRRMVQKAKPSHLAFSMDGIYGSRAEAGLEEAGRLTLRSEFFPRHNTPPVFLDGRWNLAGSYLLAGLQNGVLSDFYPVTVQWRAQADAGAEEYPRIRHFASYRQPIKAASVPGIRIPGAAENTCGASGSIRSSQAVMPECLQTASVQSGYAQKMESAVQKIILGGVARADDSCAEDIFFLSKAEKTPEYGLDTYINGGVWCKAGHGAKMKAGGEAEQKARSRQRADSRAAVAAQISYATELTVERDLWHMDGLDTLDGSHGLNPGICQSVL